MLLHFEGVHDIHGGGQIDGDHLNFPFFDLSSHSFLN